MQGRQGFFCKALGFLLLASMVRGLPVEDRLDGGSNYGSWKPRVLLALKEYDVKARKILMDSVKSHLIFHISKVEIAKDMFDILKNLFEHDSTSRSLALRSELHTIKMKRSESVDSYFTRVAEIRD